MIFSNLAIRYNTKFMKEISEALDQYTGICKEAIVDSAAKLSKSFEKVIIEVLLLYMVIPGRINFTQLGKSGKKTPHIGRFWSGCAGAVKHGLEIMGLGLIDIDSHNCMMLRAHQTPGNFERRNVT